MNKLSIISIITLLRSQSSTCQSSTSSSAMSTSGLSSLTAGLSSNCQNSAATLITGDFGVCSNIPGLFNVIGSSGSFVTPLSNYITTTCTTTPPCSNATLASVRKTVTDACSDDIAKGQPAVSALLSVIDMYPVIHNVLCTKYTGNSTFCVPFLFNNVQLASGQNLTLNDFSTLAMAPNGTALFANIPSGTYCNDCGHALITELSQASAAYSGSSTNSSSSATLKSVAQACGAGFIDGKIPSTISTGNSNSSSGTGSNASNAAKQSKASSLQLSLSTISIAVLLGWASKLLV